MKKKLELMIKHIQDNIGNICECRLCDKQESASFIEGLIEALKLIPKRVKYDKK